MDAILEKRPDETALQYHRRIIEGKLVDKTLSDYDYAELGKCIYGKEYAADHARKMFYGSQKTLELIDEVSVASISDRSMLAELDAKKAELQRERQKFFDQRREYNKILNFEGRSEHLYEAIAAAAEKTSEAVGVIFPHDDSRVERVLGENEAIVVFNDWHYGLVTSNVFNQYDTESCRQRVTATVEKMVERIDLNKCSKAHIFILGDLIHGAIHTTARVASEELACEQLMNASEILAQAIVEISKHVDSTRVLMTYGNHARTVQNKNDSMHRDNMERVVRWWLVERFRGYDNISIAPESDNEFVLANICGHGFCAVHGDLDTVKQSPRLLSTLFRKTYGIDIDYILLGDKHHRESFNEMGITARICGSLCGSDDYANGKRLYSDPSQTLLIVNEECGVDAEYDIKIF